jgi:glycosyltransferase involved in cell wall biosynthesis
MRLLFAKHSLAWPRSSGHDVHTFNMMKACAELGHAVAVATVQEPARDALAGARLSAEYRLDAAAPSNGTASCGTWLQRRFRSFWGVADGQIASLAEAARAFRADAVVVSGLDALPYFPALTGVVRVWYAADEWALHHLSQVRLGDAAVRENVQGAAIKGLYERAHRRVLDRVWVVTSADRTAMRWVAGVPGVDLLPNGVDAEFFAPGGEQVRPNSAVFWGRLDFGPNVQALEWFCRHVWPSIRRHAADATLTVVGFHPTAAVERLVADAPGAVLEPNVFDLRSRVREHAVAVLPFVSGAGIKNKLLEAAALGIPIVGTRAAVQGLKGTPPLRVGENPEAFAGAVLELWARPDLRETMARDARAWVVEHHTWASAARMGLAGIEATRSRRR